MKTGKNYKFWFATGSQDLYGEECLRNVAEHSKKIVEGLNNSGLLPYEVRNLIERAHNLEKRVEKLEGWENDGR